MGGGQAGKRGRRGGSIYQSGCFLFLDSLIYFFASCLKSLSFCRPHPSLLFFASLVFLAWWDGIEIKGTHPYLPPLLSPLLYMRVGRDLVWRCVGIFAVAVFKSEKMNALHCHCILYVCVGHHDWEAEYGVWDGVAGVYLTKV